MTTKQAKTLESRAWDAPADTTGGISVVRAQDYGRLAGIAAIAADVLFDVLNVATNHCHDETAKEWLHRRYPDKPTAVAA